MDDKKSMSWWDFAAPQELKDKVDAIANRLKLDDDGVRKFSGIIIGDEILTDLCAYWRE